MDGRALERPALVQAVIGQEWEALFGMMQEREGDMFAAVKAFAPQAGQGKKTAAAHQQAPEDNLVLEWVYGYSGQGQRSNVVYNSQEHIVYPAAAMTVVLDKVSWRQQHHSDVHSDAVSALALHPLQVLVATGQRGHNPTVAVWDSLTLKTHRVLSLGAGCRGVSALAFSPDGHTLAVATQDDGHCVWIYDWRAGLLKAKGEGGPSKVLCLSFSPDGRRLLQGGVGHFKLWTVKGRSLSGKPGLFGKTGGRKPTILAVAWHQNEGLLGAANGQLFRLEGRKVLAALDGHRRAVTSLFTYETAEGPGVVTGGMDGVVKLLDAELGPVSEFRVPAAADAGSALARGVRSVWRNRDGRKLLVGTNGGDVLELAASDGSVMNNGPLVTAHWKHELKGLAPHPVRSEFATVGGDRVLRLWDMTSRRQINALGLGEMGRSVAFAPNGLFVAIGVGGEEGKERSGDGAVLVVSLMETALRVVTRKQDSKQAMSVVKFSPNGQVLACASLDGHVYLYDVLNNFKLKAKTTEALSGPLTHLDMSLDSKLLVVNSASDEVRCFDGKTGDRVATLPDHSKLASWTCRLGPPVVGIYRDLEKTEHVSAVAQSPDGSLVATGDAFGHVSLFTFPSPTLGATGKVYMGHGANVAGVAFSVEGDFVVSAGASDRCVLQWRRELPLANAPPEKATDDKPDPEVVGPLLRLDITPALALPAPPAPVAVSAGPRVVLESVVGVRQHDRVNNLFYTPTGGLLHSLGPMAVIAHPTKAATGGGLQQVVYAHGHDVAALVLSGDGRFVASAERGPLPRTHVWDPATGRTLSVLPLAHRGDTKLLAFSSDGAMLASVGLNGESGSGGGDHSLAVFGSASGQWDDARLIAKADLDHRMPLCLAFLQGQDTQLVTGGVGHAVFWTLRGQSLSWARGSWGKANKQHILLNALVASRGLITGTQAGQLLAWQGREVSSSVCAHEGGGVVALCGTKGGERLLTGGKEGVVKLWNGRDLVLLQAYPLVDSVLPAPCSLSIRSVAMDVHETRIALGLAGDEVVEIGADTGKGLRLLQGVTAGVAGPAGAKKTGVLAAAAHPTNPEEYALVLGGDVVRVLGASEHKVLRGGFVRHAGEVMAYSADGTMLAVARGSRASAKDEYSGSVVIVQASDLKELARLQDVSRTYATDLGFSSDGASLAVVYADGSLVMYDCASWSKRWAGGPRKPDATYRLSFDASATMVRAWTAALGPIPPYHAKAANGEAIAQVPEGTMWACQTSPIVVSTQPSGAVHVAYRDAPADAFTPLPGCSAPPRATVLLADNSQLLTFSAEDGTLLSYRVLL